MSSTGILRPVGPTLGMSVAGTSHTAVALKFNTNDMVNFCAVTNVGAVAVAVKFTVAGDAAVYPGDGTFGDYVMPPLMEAPIILTIPQQAGVQVTAIGASSGPTLVYFTPMGDQS